MELNIRITSVHESGVSAFAVVTSRIGFVQTDVAAGNIRLPEGVTAAVNDSQDITGATVAVRLSEPDKDGKFGGIPWLVLS